MEKNEKLAEDIVYHKESPFFCDAVHAVEVIKGVLDEAYPSEVPAAESSDEK